MYSNSDDTLKNGLNAIVDAQKCGSRSAKLTAEFVAEILGDKLKKLYIVRPDGFWDKQRLENCTKSQKYKDVRLTDVLLLFLKLLNIYIITIQNNT